MKITLAQLNPVIGDFSGNLAKMESAFRTAAADSADLAVFSELIPSGYPPKDWLTNEAFLNDYQDADHKILQFSMRHPETAILYGGIVRSAARPGKGILNAAILVKNGRQLFVQHKTLLPTYDVFDEARYFDRSQKTSLFELDGIQLGITICEDMWNEPETFPSRPYDTDPVQKLIDQGADLLINISASPFTVGKENLRYRILRNYARRSGVPFILVNQTGANDELISDGSSMVTDGSGCLRCLLPAFEEAVQTVDTNRLPAKIGYERPDPAASVYRALTLGLRDYARKCGFRQAVLGLSGGMDSALTCCLAAAALGPENVHAVYMPSPYSSDTSGADARELAENLRVHYQVISIDSLFSAYKKSLSGPFEGTQEGVAEENIQARIRGNIIMALSNKFGWLPLVSGNKSELAVGYCTLYGDMSGGLSVLGDVFKTLVYALGRYVNTAGPVIPERIFTKAPSAELKPDQKDEDTLPCYDILDAVLTLHIEEKMSAEKIIGKGFEPETVAWILQAVQKNEYKRIQAPPVLKISGTAFGSGRRIPIAAGWQAG